MAGKRKKWDDNILSSLPPKLASTLMPFQRDGVCFAVRKMGRCLIADEMGLGKTIQAISVAYYYRKDWPLLIIVPSSLRLSWVEELEKWIPDVHPHDIYLIQSGSDISGITAAKICITTYGLLCKSTSKLLHQALSSQNFQVIIVDESHYIRNNRTASSKAVVPLVKNARRRILLSGTPSLAKPVELYPQIDALCPGKFGSWWQFTGRYCDARTENFGKKKRRNVDGASNLEELQKRLADMVMIRRLKQDVLNQLPPKQRQRVLFHLKDSKLKSEISKVFEELKPMLERSKQKRDILSATEQTASRQNLANGLIQRLYRLSGEAKIGPAREYVEMLCENTNLKFLVFAYHHAMMNGIQQTLFEKGVKFIRIDGETPPSDRLMYVQQFQSDPDIKVAILSILAAGVGLTFTAATLVVFAEMYWTPGVMIQCEDRAHRIGQSACVSVHYLVAKETMDEWVWSAVCKKTIVTTTTLNGRKQTLQAEKGDRYQIDILSNAEAFIPDDTKELDPGIFASQQPRDQMSILDFVKTGKKRKISGQQSSSKRVKSSQDTGSTQCDVIEIIDSDIDIPSSPAAESCIRDVTLTQPKRDESLADSAYESNTSKHNCDNSGNSILLSNLGTQNRNIFLLDRSDDDDFTEENKMNWSKNKYHNLKYRTTVSTSKKMNPSKKCNTSKSKKRLSLSQLERSTRNKNGEYECSKTNSWGCTACTFINHVDLPFCEICNTPKNNCDRVQCDVQADSPQNQLPKQDLAAVSVTDYLCDNQISGVTLDRGEKNVLSVYDTVWNDKNMQQHLSRYGCGKDSVDTDDESASVSNAYVDKDIRPLTTCTTLATKLDQNILTKDKLATGSISSNKVTENNQDSRTNVLHQNRIHDVLLNENPDLSLEGIFDDNWEEEVLMETTVTSDDAKTDQERHIDLDKIQVYNIFVYCCSRYTGRVYLFDQEENSLQCNFLPLDVQVDNFDQLPDLILHPSNLKLVKRFVREWNSLTETKRRLIMKSGQMFTSPLRIYEDLRSNKTHCTQRHRTKEDIATKAALVAHEMNGITRVITKPMVKGKKYDLETSTAEQESSSKRGVVQAVGEDGVPLCLNCFKPHTTKLLQTEDIVHEDNAWATRFCSSSCADVYWIKTNAQYARDKVFEAEHGKCQKCGFEAHNFYRQIRDNSDLMKRAELINNSKFCTLKAKQKEQMVKQPTAGQFWHADHIRPVWEGGGQCDIDNLRTLCVLCHQKVTAEQAITRAHVRRLGKAVNARDITAFFKPAA